MLALTAPIHPRNKESLLVCGLCACLFVMVFSLPFGINCSIAGSSPEEAVEPMQLIYIKDLNGKRIGVIAGTMLDIAANDGLDYTQIVYFDNQPSMIRALINGEIDAFIDDEPVIRYLASKFPELRRLEGSLQEDDYGFALRYEDDTLYTQVDNAVRELLADGTIESLGRKWLDSPDDSMRVMPKISEEIQEGPVLYFGTSTVSAPFTYRNDADEVVGLDIELMGLVAKRIGRRLIVTDMEFSQLIPSLQEGKVDVIGSCLSITEERKKLIHFTTAYHRGGVEGVVLAEEESSSVFSDQSVE